MYLKGNKEEEKEEEQKEEGETDEEEENNKKNKEIENKKYSFHQISKISIQLEQLREQHWKQG